MLSECDLKAVKQKQMRKDLENLKLDNSSSGSFDSRKERKKSKKEKKSKKSVLENEKSKKLVSEKGKLKKSVLKKGKKVSLLYVVIKTLKNIFD